MNSIDIAARINPMIPVTLGYSILIIALPPIAWIHSRESGHPGERGDTGARARGEAGKGPPWGVLASFSIDQSTMC